MARPYKIEDYWKQHNIESLFKELTHTLVQRMPSDPVAAIVQHLQKKFPRSFKTLHDTNADVSFTGRTEANSLQAPPTFSIRPPSSLGNTQASDARKRRDSNQSLNSSIMAMSTGGSAIPDTNRLDTSYSREAPQDINMRNLIQTTQAVQQNVKTRKNIRSDRDILEEELIKPAKIKSNVSSTGDSSTDPATANRENVEDRGEPSAQQLVKYKQRIHEQHRRRQHLEKLAQIAKEARDSEQIWRTDNESKSGDTQKKTESEFSSSQQDSDKTTAKGTQKSVAKSKEEEELLKEENTFQGRRERQRNRLGATGLHTFQRRRQNMEDFGLSTRRGDTLLMSRNPSGMCPTCGHKINPEEAVSRTDSQPVSAQQTTHSRDRQADLRGSESVTVNVDDWFEPTDDESMSEPRLLSSSSQPAHQYVTETNPFQRNAFRLLNDTNSTEQRPSAVISTAMDDKTKPNPMRTPRISESDIFRRTPESFYRSSPTRNIITPPGRTDETKRRQTEDRQSPQTMLDSTNLRYALQSNLMPTAQSSAREQQKARPSGREYTSDECD